jgi:DNA ligase-4
MTITFGAICSLLQSVENISTRNPRLAPKDEKEKVCEITVDWFANQRQNLDDPETSGSAVLSALFPHRRKDRVYGLQAPLLAKKLVTLLSFGHGQRALFDGWKTGKIGDLGVYTQRAMAQWDGTFKSKFTFPIEQIDRLLVQLAAKYRFSDASIRRQRDWDVKTDTKVKDILVRLESWEAKWLVRLLLRDHCTIELDERQVLGLYHFLLPDLLMFQNSFDAAFDMLRGDLSAYPPAPPVSQEKTLRIEAAQKLRAVVGVKVGRPTFHKAWSFKHCFQLVGNRAWAADVKYDGEYCEIHVDLENTDQDIKIYSRNGKDATTDRAPLHAIIRSALRIGRPDCLFRSKCIVLGEMVLYSDKEKTILPFSKIRKHISRSGSFMGTWQDSLPHAWEHLMIIFFDVLVVDNQAILRHCLQDRRKVLRDLVNVIPGRSMRSEWTVLGDFKTGDGVIDLKQTFSRTLASRQEGLVLKPLHTPYFPLLTEQGHRQAGFFIKMKKDYLGDMGGERDLGDFAIVGASFDAQVAPKSDLKPLHWTHFHLGCCSNKVAVQRSGAKPRFKIVATVSLDMCIPKPDVKYLNIQGYVRQAVLQKGGITDAFEVDHSKGFDRCMTVAFKEPFVAEILGGGYEKLQNEIFEMLRHPRVKKLHHDRTWEDCVTLEDLERMADEKWDIPDADELDGHAKDVALLIRKYRKEMGDSQATVASDDTTQQSTQRTTQEKVSTITPRTPRVRLPQSRNAIIQDTQRTTQETASTITPQTPRTRPPAPTDATVQETQQNTYTTVSSSQCSTAGSTQGKGIRASRDVRILVREDTSKRISTLTLPISGIIAPNPTPASTAETATKRSFTNISPPNAKRRKVLSPLQSSGGNRSLGGFEYDSQEGVMHIYANEGVKVQIHHGVSEEKEKE